MLKHYDITLARIRRFLGGLYGRVYPDRTPLELEVYAAPDRISYAEAMRGSYRPAKVGETFGPGWSTHWFRVRARVPSAWKGAPVHLLWNSRSEACVWRDGRICQGISGAAGRGGPAHLEFPVLEKAKGGEEVAYAIEMAANRLFGWSPGANIGELSQAEIARFDRAAWDLYWDLTILHDMARHLAEGHPRRGEALFTANAIVNACRLEDRRTWAAGRRLARAFLKVPNGPAAHRVSAVGHAHIDSAWLWPMAETKRKCYRTFSTVVKLMEEYPDYRFACSQAQQFEWMKTEQPELYRRIRRRVKEGRFCPAGGTWVEPDCNIPSGESLVRQFLFGQRFFQAEFGRTCREFWNPDVFGYNAQLPQIMRGAGIRHFLTQKLSWNQFNKPASHTFLWEGLDGSRVLTHFPPSDTYNATPDVQTVLASRDRFKDYERARETYLLFGYGDGGGGPNRAMLEQAVRLRDCAGVPTVEQRSPAEFFDRCEADLKDPTVWVGELYFEMHRGTYTTQADNKRDNRRGEFALRDVEFLAAVARRLGKADYPAEELAPLWKLLLFNQFHDILPGSSINQVYRDSDVHYAEILEKTAGLREEALNALAGKARSGGPLAVVNTLARPRREVVELPGEARTPQKSADGRPLALVDAPAMGIGPVPANTRPIEPVRLRRARGRTVLENAHLRAEIDRDGTLTSLVDKALGREALADGARGNRFVLFDDRPNSFDAWDVDIFHLEKPLEVGPAEGFRVRERGPLRAAVEFEVQLSKTSRIRQRIVLCADARRLEFETEVEWDEKDKFLKVEFPLAIRNEFATYEMQFGHVRRPAHYNTTWDLARFEVCGHKWADFSEPGFGVSLLNDSKYGYSTHGNTMRLSLLRAPKSPDATADIGSHRFRYALMTHAGDFRAAGVVDEGYAFNNPLQVRAVGRAVKPRSFFQLDRPNVVLDTVKKAEDSDALIVRLYEAHGARGAVRLSSPLKVGAVTRCNLLEEEEEKLAWTKGGVSFDIAPFQVVTLKLGESRG